MFSVFLLLFCNFGFTSVLSSSVRRCEEELERSRSYLEWAKGIMVAKERQRREQRIETLTRQIPKANFRIRSSQANDFFCPSFSTSSTTILATTQTPVPALTKTSSSKPTNASFPQHITTSKPPRRSTKRCMRTSRSSLTSTALPDSVPAASTPAAPISTNMIPSNSPIGNAMDPLTLWVDTMHDYLSDAKGACNGPSFRDITSITDEQLGAFVSLLAVNHGLPFCSICDSMVNQAEKELFAPTTEKLSYVDELIHSFIRAHLPSTEAICSATIPYCQRDYAANALTITPAANCMRCSVCMAVTSFIESRILLNETAVQIITDWLRTHFLSGVCSRLCGVFQPTWFWSGISYTDCMTAALNFTNQLIVRARTILMPATFCNLSIRWCENFETPSIVYCLKELCEEGLPEQLHSVCGLIPANLVQAKAFLNIEKYQ